MPDQLKEALRKAGVNAADLSRDHRDVLVNYLKSRCSVGGKRITGYIDWCLDQGVAVECSPVYIVCAAYHKSDDPERDAARRLRWSVTEVRGLRRKWGVRRGGNL